jgi:hypothetical protein
MSFGYNSIIILAASTLLFHGLILINTGNYFDGWYLAGWTDRRSWGFMRRFYKEVGMPYLFFLHRFLSSLPNHTAWYSLIILTSIFSGAFFAGNFLISSQICSEEDALIISLLMVSYPGFVIGVEKTLIHYFATPALLYLGLWLVSCASEMSSLLALLFILPAIICFFVSFCMNSILLYYLALLFICGVVTFIIPSVLSVRTILCNYKILTFVVLVLLPFVFWWVKEKKSPRCGWYKDYNRISGYSFKSIKRNIKSIFSVGMWKINIIPLKEIRRHFILAFLMLSICLIMDKFHLNTPNEYKKYYTGMIISGLFLYVFAGLPYALVNQKIGLKGWVVKNNALFPLPNSLIIYGVSRLLLDKMAWIPLLMYLVGSFLFCQKTYLSWFYDYAKNSSLIWHFANKSILKNCSLVIVEDNVKNHYVQDDPYANWTIVWSYILYFSQHKLQALGVPKHFLFREGMPHLISLPRLSELVESTSIDYDLNSIVLDQSQLHVKISTLDQSTNKHFIGLLFAVYNFIKSNKKNTLLENTFKIETSIIKEGFL